MTILIADDDEISRKLLNIILSLEGYTIVEACDGQEALAILEAASEPLIALLDWEMPGLEGVEVCRRARKVKNAHLLFLILLTARNEKEDIKTGLVAGAHDYITKPFESGKLLSRIHTGSQAVKIHANSSSDGTKNHRPVKAATKAVQTLSRPAS